MRCDRRHTRRRPVDATGGAATGSAALPTVGVATLALAVTLTLIAALTGCSSGRVAHAARAVADNPPAHPPRAASSAPPPPPRLIPDARHGTVRAERFYSPALGRTDGYLVYLPPGYATAAAHGKRFSVLYLLHAPPGQPLGFITAGGLAARADKLIGSHRIRPMIVVMPDGRTSAFRDDTEWANAAAGRYEDYMLDVVHAVDARFATVPDRSARASGGISSGGYGALNIALRHPELFSVIESWSGYFVQTPDAAFTGASPELLFANSPSDYVGGLSNQLQRLPMHVFIYQGVADELPESVTRSFARALRAAGAEVQVGFYPGKHSWRLWSAQMSRMLTFADRRMG